MIAITPKVSIVSAKRLPIGKIHGMYSEESPEELFASLVRRQLADLTAYDNKQVDQIVLGNVTNQGGNLARRCALTAGFGVEKPAYTIDSQCASGLVAIASGVQAIMSGQATMVLAGGVESTSLANQVIDRQTKNVMSRFPMVPNNQLDLDMGIVAENMSQKYHISRKQQDLYAYHSQLKAIKASGQHLETSEIYPYIKNGTIYEQDQCIRKDTTLEKLGQIKPAFKAGGLVTAGNSCPINDGAAAVLLKNFEAGEDVQGYYLGHELVGVKPEEFLLGPIAATRQLLEKQSLSISEIDVVEMNEAFAVQGILCQEALGLRDEQINPLGGALAYGHPYGATGGILIARLLHSLNRIHRPALGIVTLCVAGGMGMSVLIANKHWDSKLKC